MAEMDEVQGPAGISAKVEVEIPDCPVHLVVVYPDRAEVCSRTGLASCKDFPRVLACIYTGNKDSEGGLEEGKL